MLSKKGFRVGPLGGANKGDKLTSRIVAHFEGLKIRK